MIADDLRGAEEHYRKAAEKAEQARAVRNALIRNALRNGMTHAQVAEATGLTRGRVGQIASLRLAERHGLIRGTTSGTNLSESKGAEHA